MYLNNLQALRAFAALNVVAYHTIGLQNATSGSNYFLSVLTGWGANGVDIFFVITGFLMVYTTKRRKRSALDFLKGRITRILPIYWLLSIFLYFIYILSQQSQIQQQQDHQLKKAAFQRHVIYSIFTFVIAFEPVLIYYYIYEIDN